jgi:hypothetical protein
MTRAATVLLANKLTNNTHYIRLLRVLLQHVDGSV